jgi:alkylation response protein AidB-like acyl-CoA dehydrogenase
VLKDGTHVFAYVPTKQPGISFKGDWDVIGQRLTVSSEIPLYFHVVLTRLEA